MRRTIPQIIMLNYGAVIADKESEERVKRNRSREEHLDETDPFIPEFGVRLSVIQNDSELMDRYFSTFN